MLLNGLMLATLYLPFSASFILVHNAPRQVVKILTVDNGGPWGKWHAPAFCATGSYAVGYNSKVESYQNSGDDTELNSVMLRCETVNGGQFGGDIQSGEGTWGNWSGLTRCDNQNVSDPFITGFQLQVEKRQGGGDDTAADYIKFHCRDLNATSPEYELIKENGHGDFGDFGHWSETCPAYSAVCGIQAKIEDPQGSGDDTSLNDVKLFCCGD